MTSRRRAASSESLMANGRTYVIELGYDGAGRLTTITYPDGTVQTRAYTPRGLLDQVDLDGSLVANLDYDAGGRETTRTFGNTLATTTSYATNENLVASIANSAVGTYSYGYDANHNRTSETITGVMSGYGWSTGGSGYDAEDRLVNWDRSDSNLSQDWTLSEVGDWDSFTQNGTPESLTHGPSHELTAVGPQAVTHDVKGNLTADHLGRSYVWDADNHLRQLIVASGAAVGQPGTHTYAYDALGRRVSRSGPGVNPGLDVYVNLTVPIPPLGTLVGQVIAEYFVSLARCCRRPTPARPTARVASSGPPWKGRIAVPSFTLEPYTPCDSPDTA